MAGCPKTSLLSGACVPGVTYVYLYTSLGVNRKKCYLFPGDATDASGAGALFGQPGQLCLAFDGFAEPGADPFDRRVQVMAFA